jgi:hypothetical protein
MNCNVQTLTRSWKTLWKDGMSVRTLGLAKILVTCPMTLDLKVKFAHWFHCFKHWHDYVWRTSV